MLLSPRKKTPNTWVELPESRFGIEYALRGETKAWQQHSSPRKPVNKFRRAINNGATGKSVAKMSSPFETSLDHLSSVIRRDGHPDGTAVMYIREIFEPGDWEFESISEHSYVCATQLSQEQVDRLRIMVLPKRRENILVAYLDHYRMSYQRGDALDETVDALHYFEAFDRRFITTTDQKAKFDVLFGFTFAIKRFSGWMFRYENERKREKMIASLAKHWRRLLGVFKPEEFGCDREFSYPALLTFLETFKRQAESIETFNQSPIKFVYKAEKNVKVVSFDDETISSLSKRVKSQRSIENDVST